jgi:VWFA-related protein
MGNRGAMPSSERAETFPRRRDTRRGSLVIVFAIASLAAVASDQDRNSAQAGAAAAPRVPSQAPTFSASSRLVLVDVVALNSKGEPLVSLKATDFILLEDGEVQQIRVFEPHVAAASKVRLPPLDLPPHQYTNFRATEANAAVNILLFDMLNTDQLQRAYARKQMLEFLKQLPKGRRVALFALGTHLHMLQGFTGDSETLIAAANSVLVQKSLLTTSEADRQTDEIITENLAANASSRGNPSGMDQQVLKALNDEANLQKDARLQLTLQSLTMLAGTVSGYPGRKNLLWLSTDFPFRFGPESANSDLHRRDPQEFLQALPQAAALMAAAQIAVYPIDLGGVSSGGAGGDQADISTPAGFNTGPGTSTVQTAAANAELRRAIQHWDTHEAMVDIARDTGGEALYGSNDLKNLMAHSIERGENYYTLAYVPANRDWNGKYRKIEVKLAQPARLYFRRGYYALPRFEIQGVTPAQLLALAARPGLPELTMLLLKVQVLPPDREHQRVRIDYALAPSDISFSDGPNQRKDAQVDFLAVAWDKNGKEAGHALDSISFTLRKEKYAEVLDTGLPAHQELQLKPGSYTLRLAVMDRNSRKIGSVTVPLAVEEQSSGN